MISGASLSVFATAEEAYSSAAKLIAEGIKKAIRDRGSSIVALSGGNTPRSVYRLLGSSPYSESVEWGRVHLLFGDERMVPPGDPMSNFRMVDTELISRIPIPPENVHRIAGEKEPMLAAREYTAVLDRLLSGNHARPDLILLGLGRDGHTASLFPPLEEKPGDHKALAVYVEQLKTWRVTLTPPFINSARRIIFLVTGKEKAEILRRVLAQEKQIPLLPATIIRPAEGECLWIVDRDAASLLP